MGQTKVVQVRGVQFVEERVVVDGKHFIGCTFERCTLAYTGGDPFLVEGAHSVEITFEGPAANTLDTLRTLYRFGGAEWVETIFASIRNPLGERAN